MTKDKKVTKAPTGYRIYSQYVLVGAALGFYYGAFYRATSTSPDFGMANILAMLTGLVTTVVGLVLGISRKSAQQATRKGAL